ncbi:MAG: hypothetical protein M3041_05740 [Acidobacteriota bacterium]|nr:hypothetical protein [Acidobacteriota bacterium]
MLERRSDLVAPRFVNQSDQRVGLDAAGCLHAAAKSNERPLFASSRPPIMEADVSRCLKNEARQRFEILDPVFAQRFECPPQRLLRNILGREAIAQAARGEDTQPLPEAIAELDSDLVRRAAERKRGYSVGGDDHNFACLVRASL